MLFPANLMTWYSTGKKYT